MDIPTETQLSCLHGEERYYISNSKGEINQGYIASMLTQAVQEVREGEMKQQPEGSLAWKWMQLQEASGQQMREHVSRQCHKISKRFRVRLWSDTLPTYAREGKRCTPGTSYEYVYADLIRDEECRACSMKQKETAQHIMSECPAGQILQARQTAIKNAEGVWKEGL